MKLLALASCLLVLAVKGTAGLRCYACMPDRQIAGAQLDPVLTNQLRQFPRCSDMNKKDPGLNYELTCPRGMDQTCVKITDEKGNEMRSCFVAKAAKCSHQTKKGQSLCTCKGDFCNTAAAAAPGLLILLLSATAALLRLY